MKAKKTVLNGLFLLNFILCMNLLVSLYVTRLYYRVYFLKKTNKKALHICKTRIYKGTKCLACLNCS